MAKIASENGILKITDSADVVKAILFRENGKTVMVAADGALHHEAGAALSQIGADLSLTNAAAGIDAGETLFDLDEGYTTSALSLFQGFAANASNGYAVGGLDINIIDKFPFASNVNAANAGTMTSPRGALASTGASSSTHGYTSPDSNFHNIEKFSFASTSSSIVGAGSFTQSGDAAGVSSPTHGFFTGATPPSKPVQTFVDKFPFSSDTDATNVGSLAVRTNDAAGQSSDTHGYSSGGSNPPAPAALNVIQKFPFAISSASTTDIADLSLGRAYVAGHSSGTHGYASAGNPGQPTIDRFPFGSDQNSTDIGNLQVGRYFSFGVSSATHGYTGGGIPASAPEASDYEKFPFTSSGNAATVGSLSTPHFGPTGVQG